VKVILMQVIVKIVDEENFMLIKTLLCVRISTAL